MDLLAIEARQIARRYGRRWALIDVSFQVQRGEVVMLAGPNGAGKTTLLRVLATVLRPDAGTASVGGFDVVRQRDPLRRKIAFLAHQSYLYEALTAQENLELVARFCGAPALLTTQLLDRVGLSARADDLVSTFSAGMRKRLSFARVLLQSPEIVFLDEPYGQLDPQGFVLVDEVIAELKGRGATVIIATHQLEHVRAYADRALTLSGGRVAA